nr:leukocyte surface antigen CD53-like [Leptinotarsa decemlineata]
MGCSTTVVKYLVFFFNVIFAISGASLVAIGVLLKMKNTDIQNFIPDKYHLGLPPLLLIVIGAVIFITASFGCCGAIKENTCMLTTFAIILLTLLIIQVAIGAFAFLLVGDTQDLRESVRQVVKNSFDDYNNTKLVKDEFDFLQTFLECCGVDRPQDWNWANEKLPDSCCASRANCTLKSSDCYRKGCAENSYKWFKNGLDLLGILAIAVASIELIGAIFALCLSSSIKNQLRREAYA